VKDDEIRRLQRLRERQLQARDPHAKQRKIDRRIADRRRRLEKRESFSSIFTDVPHKWQGVVVGVLIGAIISILLSLLVHAAWTDVIGVALIVVFAIIGFYFGQALDVRDELRDLTK